MEATCSSPDSPKNGDSQPGTCPQHGDFVNHYVVIGPHAGWAGCEHCRTLRLQEADRKRRAEERQAHEDRLKRIRQDAEAERYAGAMLPSRFADRTLANYEATLPQQEKNLRIVRAYVDRWDECREVGRCMLLLGAVGTGKTHLAAAIANEVLGRGQSALFRTVPEAIRFVKASYGDNRERTEQQAYDLLVKPDLLILDDVGAIPLSAHDLGILTQVIGDRCADRRPVLLTSNAKNRAELEAILGDRVVDRLMEGKGVTLVFDWDSHRSK